MTGFQKPVGRSNHWAMGDWRPKQGHILGSYMRDKCPANCKARHVEMINVIKWWMDSVADLGEGPGGPPPLILGKKRRNDCREKASRASKSRIQNIDGTLIPKADMTKTSLESRVTFAVYEFDGDEADVVNGMASLVKV